MLKNIFYRGKMKSEKYVRIWGKWENLVKSVKNRKIW